MGKDHSYTIKEHHIREGLKNAYWPGRFEILSHNPIVILDGAHNEEGVNALTAELKKRYHDKKKDYFSALADKKLDEMIHIIDRSADEITFVSFDYPRATSVEELLSYCHNEHKNMQQDWKQAS